jgi:hypothetical protein
VKKICECMDLGNCGGDDQLRTVYNMLSIINHVFSRYGVGARTSRGYGRFRIIKYMIKAMKTSTPSHIRSRVERRSRRRS